MIMPVNGFRQMMKEAVDDALRPQAAFPKPKKFGFRRGKLAGAGLHVPDGPQMVAGWAQLFCGHPAEALELAERSAGLNSEWDSTYWGLVPAYVQLDRLPEAQVALAKFLSLAPEMTVSRLRQLLPIRNQASLAGC